MSLKIEPSTFILFSKMRSLMSFVLRWICEEFMTIFAGVFALQGVYISMAQQIVFCSEALGTDVALIRGLACMSPQVFFQPFGATETLKIQNNKEFTIMRYNLYPTSIKIRPHNYGG